VARRTDHPRAWLVLWGQPIRVLRGGAWNNNPQNARAASRNRNEPTNRNNRLGARLVLVARMMQGD
jgi:formylglycine-generating enzyme required for sulfatase activity